MRISWCLNWEDRDNQDFSGENDNYDVCRRHPLSIIDLVDRGLLPESALLASESADESPLDVGCEHPPYDETDYQCAICGRPLSSDDD